jgi:hypothetical protein
LHQQAALRVSYSQRAALRIILSAGGVESVRKQRRGGGQRKKQQSAILTIAD